MQTIKYAKTGGQIRVDVRSGFANPGSYDLFVWAAHSNKKVLERAGNFMNVDDDRYTLPGAAKEQDGRIIEAFVTFSSMNEDGRNFAWLVVSQDGIVLDEVLPPPDTRMSAPRVTPNLFARLEA